MTATTRRDRGANAPSRRLRRARQRADAGRLAGPSAGRDRTLGGPAVAAAKVPGADLREGDLHQLPLPDQHVDVVVCALALTHVPELAPVLTEFVRVLRPGGHLVISDSRGLLGYFGSPVVKALPGGVFGYLPHRNWLTSDYLAAALPLGLRVRRCAEPQRPCPLIDPEEKPPADAVPAGKPPDIWELHSWSPAATNAAYRDNPAAIVWHFQLPATAEIN